MNSTPISIQLKRLRLREKSAMWKKTKVSKAMNAFEELMMEQRTVLGALRAHLQELQVRPPRMMMPHVLAGTSKAKQILCTHTANTLVLPEGAVLATVEGDKATTSPIKCCRLNLDAHPRETLYQLQDGVTAELHSREGATSKS